MVPPSANNYNNTSLNITTTNLQISSQPPNATINQIPNQQPSLPINTVNQQQLRPLVTIPTPLSSILPINSQNNQGVIFPTSVLIQQINQSNFQNSIDNTPQTLIFVSQNQQNPSSNSIFPNSVLTSQKQIYPTTQQNIQPQQNVVPVRQLTSCSDSQYWNGR